MAAEDPMFVVNTNTKVFCCFASGLCATASPHRLDRYFFYLNVNCKKIFIISNSALVNSLLFICVSVCVFCSPLQADIPLMVGIKTFCRWSRRKWRKADLISAGISGVKTTASPRCVHFVQTLFMDFFQFSFPPSSIPQRHHFGILCQGFLYRTISQPVNDIFQTIASNDGGPLGSASRPFL